MGTGQEGAKRGKIFFSQDILQIYFLYAHYKISIVSLMAHSRSYSPATLEAARILGKRIRLARLERRWTLAELAERAGTSVPTIRKIEAGQPNVSLGLAFEAAALTGVPLFHEDRSRLTLEASRLDDRLAVLPRLVRKPTEVDNDF